jgi:hypothetical protein
MIGGTLRLSRYVFAVLAGLCGAAFYVQIARPLQSEFASAFRPQPYWDHPQLGPVFGPPNYRGFMQIRGGGSTRVELDAFGLQPETKSTSVDAPLILVLGGASQTFGFGLPRGKSIPERIVPNLCGPARVRSTALPGHDIAAGWLRFLATRRPGEIADIVVITSLGTRSFLSLDGVPPPTEEFRTFDVPAYMSRWAAKLGVDEFESPAGLKTKFEFGEGLRQNFIGRWIVAKLPAVARSGRTPTFTLGPNEFAGLAYYQEFLKMLRQHSNILVVGYPLRTPDDPYAPLEIATPLNIPFLNLHNLTKAENIELDWFPDGHYREVSSDTIGRLIAEQICVQGWVGATK